jgi:hypothetical protein
MTTILSLTSTQLRQAADLQERISELQQQLHALLTADSLSSPRAKKKFKMSAAARAKIGAAQKARWAKTTAARDLKNDSSDDKKKSLRKSKPKMSAAVRAKIAAAAKARWAKAKAAGKTSL